LPNPPTTRTSSQIYEVRANSTGRHPLLSRDGKKKNTSRAGAWQNAWKEPYSQLHHSRPRPRPAGRVGGDTLAPVPMQHDPTSAASFQRADPQASEPMLLGPTGPTIMDFRASPRGRRVPVGVRQPNTAILALLPSYIDWLPDKRRGSGTVVPAGRRKYPSGRSCLRRP